MLFCSFDCCLVIVPVRCVDVEGIDAGSSEVRLAGRVTMRRALEVRMIRDATTIAVAVM